jgi:O-antigen/teichoic acid export membrane protein
VRHALTTYGTNLLVAALSLVNVLIISRALGPEGRGDVAFLTTMALITASLAMLGVHQASVNIAGREPEQRATLATNAVLLSLILGALAAACVALVIAGFPEVGGDAEGALMMLALAAVPVLILRTYLWGLAVADYGFTWANAAWVVGPAVNAVANGVMAAFGVLDVGPAIVTWIAGQAIGDVILIVSVIRRQDGFGRPSVALARRTIGFGVKAHLGSIMLVGNYRVDQWLMGAISGFTELGLYSVAVAWGEALFFLPTALAMVQRPDLVRARDEADAARQVAPVFRGAMWATFFVAAAMFVAAPFLCTTVFGEEFSGATDDLRVLIPGGFGIVAMKLFGNALTGRGRPMLETSAIAIAFASTIVLDLVLIPPYGGLGAALASSIAYLIGGLAAGAIFVGALGGRARDLIPRPGDIATVLGLVRTAALRARRETA